MTDKAKGSVEVVDGPERWKTNSQDRSRRAINISSNSGRALQQVGSSAELKHTLHAEESPNPRDSLPKALVESQVSDGALRLEPR